MGHKFKRKQLLFASLSYSLAAMSSGNVTNRPLPRRCIGGFALDFVGCTPPLDFWHSPGVLNSCNYHVRAQALCPFTRRPLGALLRSRLCLCATSSSRDKNARTHISKNPCVKELARCRVLLMPGLNMLALVSGALPRQVPRSISFLHLE